jgi:hypothetical protein
MFKYQKPIKELHDILVFVLQFCSITTKKSELWANSFSNDFCALLLAKILKNTSTEPLRFIDVARSLFLSLGIV